MFEMPLQLGVCIDASHFVELPPTSRCKKNAIELWLIILLRGSNAINSFHTVALVWLIDCQSKIFQHVHTMLLIQQLNSSWLHRMHFTQSTFAHFHAVIGNFIDRSDGFAMVFSGTVPKIVRMVFNITFHLPFVWPVIIKSSLFLVYIICLGGLHRIQFHLALIVSTINNCPKSHSSF